MKFTTGQNVTLTFEIENTGGTEGEANIILQMPDFEIKNRTWIKAGKKENISFSFAIPDDLEEKAYKGIYKIDEKKGEFSYFVYGANISVNASLDKSLYVENETALFTLNITNAYPINLSLYARVKFSDYEEVTYFNLTNQETLQFNIPVHFNGQKLFYGIYMASGRALYLNAMYIYKKEILTLHTDRQVYNSGENVTIFVDTSKSGTLNITAPGFNTSMLLIGSTSIEFGLPDQLSSGTYYIEYAFDNISYTYPFDVVGYSARILEFSLNKELYNRSDVINASMDMETNLNISGVIRFWIYDSENNLIKTFEINRNLVKGENKIEASGKFYTNLSGLHSLVYSLYANSDLMLSSGVEYFDVYIDTIPPLAVSNLSVSSAGLTWLNFTWNNPPDPDFSHVMLYLDGSFITNVSAPQNFYNITGLSQNTSYELGTLTVDTSGNVNQTWVFKVSTTASSLKGDLNGNGRIDIGDAAWVAYMVTGKVPADLSVDFNGNNRVDIGDAAKIVYYLVGKVDKL